MSLAAAIGYAIGILIFAMIIRRNRKRLIERHITRAKRKKNHEMKGRTHD